MKILYNKQDGKVFYVVKEIDLPFFSHSTNITLDELNVDEIEDNKHFYLDMFCSIGKKDVNGLGKYYIENSTIYVRDDWEEVQDV